MKKILLVLIFGTIFFSCSSDSSSSSSGGFSNTPLAKAMYDNSNYGIYKGVFVGSSGTVLININNDGTISATLTIDGNTFRYTTTESITENTTIEGLTFTNESSTFDFNVSENGDGSYISNISINGHPNARIELFKEYSDAIVKCYIGSYSGTSSGLFNLIISDGEVGGLILPDVGTYFNFIGNEVDGSITGYFFNGSFNGTINGNNVNGTWQNNQPGTGEWSATRKL